MNLRDEQAAMRARQEYVRKKRKEKPQRKHPAKRALECEVKTNERINA